MAVTAAAATRLAALPAHSGWLTSVELVALGAIWGASFLFMRVAAPEFGPAPLVAIRIGLGALVLLPALWLVRSRLNRALWLRLAVIGALNSALPFALFAWAATQAPAAIGAITNSLTALFTALVAFALYGERICARRAAGLAGGFAGVVVLVGSKAAGADATLAVLAGVTAALLYGIAANLVRRHLADLPPVAVAAATLVCATLFSTPFALASWPAHPIGAGAWASAALLGVLCTGIAYALYFRLIQRIGAPRAVTVVYLVPLFGVFWAWLVLGEPVTPALLVAGALILGGVAISQTSSVRAAKRAPDAAPDAP